MERLFNSEKRYSRDNRLRALVNIVGRDIWHLDVGSSHPGK